MLQRVQQQLCPLPLATQFGLWSTRAKNHTITPTQSSIITTLNGIDWIIFLGLWPNITFYLYTHFGVIVNDTKKYTVATHWFDSWLSHKDICCCVSTFNNMKLNEKYCVQILRYQIYLLKHKKRNSKSIHAFVRTHAKNVIAHGTSKQAPSYDMYSFFNHKKQDQVSIQQMHDEAKQHYLQDT